jgi:mono/diheme cytochrome c family protein
LVAFVVFLIAGCGNTVAVSVPQQARLQTPAAAGAEVFPLPSAKPAITQDIKSIYASKCASCHGEKGDGRGPSAANLSPKPTDFTNAVVLREKTPLEFYKAITLGEATMPEHRVVLTLEERWALVFHVRSFTRSEADLARGLTLYRENCSVCHGLRGLGAFDGPEPNLARHLNPLPRNFTDFAWMADKPDSRFFTSITQGRTWTAMPAWGGTISEADRWILIHYLRTFTYTP